MPRAVQTSKINNSRLAETHTHHNTQIHGLLLGCEIVVLRIGVFSTELRRKSNKPRKGLEITKNNVPSSGRYFSARRTIGLLGDVAYFARVGAEG